MAVEMWITCFYDFKDTSLSKSLTLTIIFRNLSLLACSQFTHKIFPEQ